MKNDDHGFTLIELMIVVAIVGVLAAIAIPKFAQMMRKSGEATSKGNLGALRSALSIYYGDLEGTYPTALTGLTVSGKYLAVIPNAKTPNYHADTSVEVDNAIGNVGNTGAWLFNNIPTDTNFGQVNVNCTDTDTKSNVWSSY